jgi:hypothetical protein
MYTNICTSIILDIILLHIYVCMYSIISNILYGTRIYIIAYQALGLVYVNTMELINQKTLNKKKKQKN